MVTLKVITALVFVFVGPFVGMLLKGFDRKITAKMQSRVGPPILQPFYDVRKLMSKDEVAPNSVIDFYIGMSLLFAILSGIVFFFGGNLFLVAFSLTLSSLFLILSAYSTRSPFAEIGAQREAIQVMCYEPLMLLLPVAIYLVTGSFNVGDVVLEKMPCIVYIPLVFLSYLFILTIKLRKSPFDLSTSHHAHQELVKGLTTEMSGKTLALFEIMEWYESVLFLGILAMFFVSSVWWSWIVAVAVCIVCYLLEILVDNSTARVKWQAMLKWSWVLIFMFFLINIVVLSYFVG